MHNLGRVDIIDTAQDIINDCFDVILAHRQRGRILNDVAHIAVKVLLYQKNLLKEQLGFFVAHGVFLVAERYNDVNEFGRKYIGLHARQFPHYVHFS